MLNLDFPYTVTFISGFLAFVLGLVWYHPKVMGKKWLEARGKTLAETQATPMPMAASFLLWMVAATFYSFLAQFNAIDDVPGFFCLASLLWVAFAMPPTVMGAFYTGYPFQAVAVDSAYHLAGYYVFAAVHIAFRTIPALAPYA